MIIPILTNQKLVAKLFLIVSAILLCVAIYNIFKTIDFLKNSVQTYAQIVGYEDRLEKDDDGYEKITSFPILQFYDSKGTFITFRSDVAMNHEVWIYKKSLEENANLDLFVVPDIKIRYPIGDTSSARASRNWFDIWGLVAVLTFISFVFFLVGAANYYMSTI